MLMGAYMIVFCSGDVSLNEQSRRRPIARWESIAAQTGPHDGDPSMSVVKAENVNPHEGSEPEETNIVI